MICVITDVWFLSRSCNPNYAAGKLNRFSNISFALRRVYPGFTVCNVPLVHVGLFLKSAWLTFYFNRSIAFI